MNENFLRVRVENIPSELKALRQWVLWRGVERDGRWTKVPYSMTGQRASSADRATWADFDSAADGYMSGPYDGIGFVFAEGGGLVGVDLDRCLRDGELEPKAAAIVEALGSYTEYSVSGAGLHVIARASLKQGIRTSSRSRIEVPVEIYPRGRYFTVTGKPYGDNPSIIDGQRVVDYLSGVISPQADTKPAKGPHSKRRRLDNDGIIKKAMSSRNGDKFRRLWEGDTSMHGGDDSRADAALIRMLLFWADGDEDRADFLFRQSGLYREEKWDKRPDYRKRAFDFVTGAGRAEIGRG